MSDSSQIYFTTVEIFIRFHCELCSELICITYVGSASALI